ncbi:hypothetical protein TNCV_1071351 [Trichonephila clavipes]|nr:hypothetical protein TNCV_1071351 [Trichonephila clavipes]
MAVKETSFLDVCETDVPCCASSSSGFFPATKPYPIISASQFPRMYKQNLRGVFLQRKDGLIYVWRLRDERILATSPRHHHNRASPSMIIWGAIRYTSPSPLVIPGSTLNSARNTSDVLRPVSQAMIRALQNSIFQ